MNNKGIKGIKQIKVKKNIKDAETSEASGLSRSMFKYSLMEDRGEN